MDTTITLGDAGLLLIGLAFVVLLFYSISLVKNLIPAVKTLNKILEDTQVITAIAAESTETAQRMLSDVSESVGTVTKAIKGNQNVIQALTSLVNAVTALKNLLKK
ncbi:MAG: hypothetical protein PHQ50_04090 [Eubacteriales bacterium]|nr:hypothetical protein [Eubacteriales bacterium]MDD3350365.1 hypothetical protein [Eubacteriales bacterium]